MILSEHAQIPGLVLCHSLGAWVLLPTSYCLCSPWFFVGHVSNQFQDSWSSACPRPSVCLILYVTSAQLPVRPVLNTIPQRPFLPLPCQYGCYIRSIMFVWVISPCHTHLLPPRPRCSRPMVSPSLCPFIPSHRTIYICCVYTSFSLSQQKLY